MFIDKNLMFADDVAITAAQTYTSDAMPLHTVGEMSREGKGEGLEVIIQVTEAFVGGTSVDFRGTTGTTNGLANADAQATTGAVPTAELTLGAKFRLPLAMYSADADAAWFGIQAVSLGIHTAGKYSAWVQRVGEDQDSY